MRFCLEACVKRSPKCASTGSEMAAIVLKSPEACFSLSFLDEHARIELQGLPTYSLVPSRREG